MIEFRQDHPLLRFWSDADTYHLDVRELLETGGEPYLFILDCVHQLTPGDTLVVHALFEPKPLVAQMGRMGYRAHTERLDAEHWTVTITQPEDS